jgi:hypothetical protein
MCTRKVRIERLQPYQYINVYCPFPTVLIGYMGRGGNAKHTVVV